MYMHHPPVFRTVPLTRVPHCSSLPCSALFTIVEISIEIERFAHVIGCKTCCASPNSLWSFTVEYKLIEHDLCSEKNIIT